MPERSYRVLFWVLAPLPMLFHPWFVRGIILPLV